MPRETEKKEERKDRGRDRNRKRTATSSSSSSESSSGSGSSRSSSSSSSGSSSSSDSSSASRSPAPKRGVRGEATGKRLSRSPVGAKRKDARTHKPKSSPTRRPAKEVPKQKSPVVESGAPGKAGKENRPERERSVSAKREKPSAPTVGKVPTQDRVSPLQQQVKEGRSRSRSKDARERKRSLSPAKTSKIHVGKLTRNVTKDHVMEIFSVYGAIKHVDLPVDRIHSHLNRSFAYVEFESPEDAEKAMKHMDGGQIDGQEITAAPVLVPKSRPPQRRSSPNWRAGGGGGGWRRSPPRYRGGGGGGGRRSRSPAYRRSPRRRRRSSS